METQNNTEHKTAKELVFCELSENEGQRIDLVLRLTKSQLNKLLLEKGKQPKKLYSRIVIEQID